MSVQPLLSQLQHDAGQEVAARLERARAEAASLLQDEAGEEQRALRHALAEHERNQGQQLDRERDEVVRACLLEVLESRRRLVERVLTRVRSLVPELTGDPAFREAVCALARRALEYLPPDERVVRCHPALVDVVRPAIVSPATLETDAQMPFGFVAHTPDGRVHVDATLDELVQRAERDLAMHIVAWHGATDAATS